MSEWVRVITEPTRKAMAEMERRTDRATMWALREAGREVRKVARRQAPVYGGPRDDVPRGRLKKSIKSARRIRNRGGVMILTVGPRGWPAQGYAPKIERLQPYMAPAFAEAAPLLEEAAVRGWRRAMEK